MDHILQDLRFALRALAKRRGFTMSLFIADLAFGGTPALDLAKIGVLGASLIAGVVGWALLRFSGGPVRARV